MSEVSKLAEADSLMTWFRDGAVKLRMTDSGLGAEPPMTLMTLFKNTVDRYPDRIALSTKEGGSWTGYTYKWYFESVCSVAKAFIKLGLEPFHSVGIIGFNSPEWYMSHLGAIMAGGFATSIYTTNSPEACHYVLENSGCQIVVVENDTQLQKILQIRDRLPELRSIIQYKGEPPKDCLDVLTWAGLMQYGEDAELNNELQKRIAAQTPNRCCTLIYTSGTTGDPKGVMLSHDNVTWTARAAAEHCRFRYGAEIIVSYLPLSHIAAQIFDIYIPINNGSTVYFAQPDALKGSLKTTLSEVRPTLFIGVPRVWEKFQEAMIAAGRNNGFLKRRIVTWAKNIGLRSNMRAMRGQRKVLCYPLARALVFKKVRAALGFDRCEFFLSAAAPLMRETCEFFMSLDIPITEAFGMSECSGPQAIGVLWDYMICSVGKELSGCSTKLDTPDENGEGEVCIRGRHVFMGYLNMEEKTKEALDEEGWLHSGDIGRKDVYGYLYITGRIKELIITAGGENIPPVPIEDKVKGALPCVSNCMLVGDKRKFLSVLITLKTDVDPNTMEPFDTLTPIAVDWCRSVGSSANTVSEIIDNNDNKVHDAIDQGIEAVNKTATSKVHCIQKWSILRRDFSVYGGELGPTMKLKRPEVLRMYNDTIEALYETKD